MKKLIYSFVFIQGAPFTALEPGHDINQVCPVPGTGLIFMAVENTQMLSYYIPVSYITS